jgi:hypothetical protein
MNHNKKQEVLTLLPIYAWVMLITIGGHFLNIHSSWVFGIMVPIFFIMGGEINQKIKTVVGGALTGLIFSYLLCIAVNVLSGIIGPAWGWVLPVSLVVAALMLLRPFFPYVCNNVAFLYMVIATKDAASFFEEFWSLLIYFVVGGVIYLGGILLIVKTLQKLAMKKAASGK